MTALDAINAEYDSGPESVRIGVMLKVTQFLADFPISSLRDLASAISTASSFSSSVSGLSEIITGYLEFTPKLEELQATMGDLTDVAADFADRVVTTQAVAFVVAFEALVADQSALADSILPWDTRMAFEAPQPFETMAALSSASPAVVKSLRAVVNLTRVQIGIANETVGALMDSLQAIQGPLSSALAQFSAAASSINGARTIYGFWFTLLTAAPTLTDITYFSDVQFQSSCSVVNVTFEAFADPSGVQAYSVCIGSSPLFCDVLPPRAIVATLGLTAQTVTLDGLPLSPGVQVFVTVAGMSGTGVVTASSTNGVLCENRPPSASAVVVLDTGRQYIAPSSIAGAGRAANGGISPQDVDCDVEGAGVGAAWRGFQFFVGLDHYEWALGSAPGLADLLPWTSVGVSTSVFNASMALPAGAVYFAAVRAVDSAGMATVAVSDGVLVLPAPPAAMALGVAASNATALDSLNSNGTAALLASLPRGSFVCLGSPTLLALGGGRGAPALLGLDTLA
jgi:hypothetical protein